MHFIYALYKHSICIFKSLLYRRLHPTDLVSIYADRESMGEVLTLTWDYQHQLEIWEYICLSQSISQLYQSNVLGNGDNVTTIYSIISCIILWFHCDLLLTTRISWKTFNFQEGIWFFSKRSAGGCWVALVVHYKIIKSDFCLVERSR